MVLAQLTFVIGFTFNQRSARDSGHLVRDVTEVGDGGEDVFDGQTLGSHGFQARVSEEIAAHVFGFGNAVSHQNQAIPGVQTDVVALVGGIGQQADGQAALGRTDHLMIANQQRRHVAAVHVFHFPITLKPRNDQGRVFLADMLVGEESVGRSYNLLQGHSSEKLGMDHALKDGSQQRGGNSLAADIGQHHGQTLVGIDRVEEVAPFRRANGTSGMVTSISPC